MFPGVLREVFEEALRRGLQRDQEEGEEVVVSRVSGHVHVCCLCAEAVCRPAGHSGESPAQAEFAVLQDESSLDPSLDSQRVVCLFPTR